MGSESKLEDSSFAGILKCLGSAALLDSLRLVKTPFYYCTNKKKPVYAWDSSSLTSTRGDVFYLHARLLERGAKLSNSATCGMQDEHVYRYLDRQLGSSTTAKPERCTPFGTQALHLPSRAQQYNTVGPHSLAGHEDTGKA